jgi:superfamily II DNA or RNA helicase
MTFDNFDTINKAMLINYAYPKQSDPNFQLKIYKKREFNIHSTNSRPNIDDDEAVTDYRTKMCTGNLELFGHQQLLSNFINPNTPYKGLLLFHGLGTGKTCAAINIAEKFKNMVIKYGTKIHILVPGPYLKENWKSEIIKCTGDEYYKSQNVTISKEDREKYKKVAQNNASQYYKFISYKSFAKRVIGEKISDKIVSEDTKVKVTYRKTDEGEFVRDLSIDRIYNLNNTLMIVEEAHNLTGNIYGEALIKIIENSSNLKIILLTATPMKNSAVDIVELINYIRPKDSKIEKDKIFTNDNVHLIDIKPGAMNYLKKMTSGYVSRVKGNDPLIFAKRIDMGIKPKELLFTKITRCTMSKFQRKIYDITMEEKAEDALDRKMGAVSNFVFPGFGVTHNEIKGYFAREGILNVKNQLKTNKNKLNKLIAKEILNITDEEEINELMYITNDDLLSGKIFNIKYLKYFSAKFYKAMSKINNLIWGKKGAQTSFVYSNLVKSGIELFEQVLLQNGYLQYNENSNYNIKSDTVCYFCGQKNNDHKISNDMPNHEFYPATFVTFTGKTEDELTDYVPEEKQKIIDLAFNIIENQYGKIIKILLGSKVMNEGISLRQVGQVHILDVYFNLNKVDQTIGRAIRTCSHYKLMSDINKFPEVKVYKYTVALENGKLSSEEELYRKAELKYVIIKKVERALSETAIDCPLNVHGNIFAEEVEKYKDCGSADNPCPVECDFTSCEYKCNDAVLNTEYYDPSRKIYKKLKKSELDYSTFNNSLASYEIDYSKRKIKELFYLNYVYALDKITTYIKDSYDKDKKDLFDDFFVFKALDELIPITENDFNNFKDTIYDKYNRPGYLIYVNNFYIFQPLDQNTDVPMYYRSTYDKILDNPTSLQNYVKNTDKYKINKNKKETTIVKIVNVYDFDSTFEYYDSRKENKNVGIIDKESGNKKNKNFDELLDVFKIREKRSKILKNKRGTGIPSLKGSVCFNSKTKNHLIKLAKEYDIKLSSEDSRTSICDLLKEKFLFLEKYATEKDGNKKTYMIIPANHPKYQFPYNLEDRIEFIINKIKSKLNLEIKFNIKIELKNKLPTYTITFNDTEKINKFNDYLINYNFKLSNQIWKTLLE